MKEDPLEALQAKDTARNATLEIVVAKGEVLQVAARVGERKRKKGGGHRNTKMSKHRTLRAAKSQTTRAAAPPPFKNNFGPLPAAPQFANAGRNGSGQLVVVEVKVAEVLETRDRLRNHTLPVWEGREGRAAFRND